MRLKVNATTTAVIVVDMWNNHICKTFVPRVNELAEKMNEPLDYFRASGIPILHMCAEVADYYKDTPQFQGLQRYQMTMPKTLEIEQATWPGQDYWNRCICEDGTHCLAPANWTAIHPAIRIEDQDLIGRDIDHIPFLRVMGITCLLYCGIATNVCVLNARPFSVIQARGNRFGTILLSDLTEAYVPGTTREQGNQQAIDHFETYICPTTPWREIELLGMGVWL